MAARSSSKKRRLEVSIEHIPAAKGSLAPYAAFFPSGLPENLHHPSQNDSEDGVSFQAFRNAAPFKGKQQLLVGRGEGVDYVGTNLPLNQGNRYAIGLFNKTEGTLKVAALAGGKVFRMEPRVPGLEYENDETAAAAAPEEEKDQAALVAERRAKREMLVETFGSRKARVQQNAQRREKVEEDAIAAPEALASMLAEAVTAVPSREEATRSGSALENRLIPPCIPEATTPAAAYPVDLLIPPEVQSALDIEPFKKAARHPDRPLKMYFGGEVSSLVRNRVYKLAVQGDHPGANARQMCLAYLNHLLEFYRLAPGKIGKTLAKAAEGIAVLAREVGIPVFVFETFMEKFLTKLEGRGGEVMYARPQRSADLTIAYILVAALHVDQFCSDPADIAEVLQLTVSQLMPRYKELGCKVRKLSKAQREAAPGGSGYEVTLPTPVVFPAIKRGR